MMARGVEGVAAFPAVVLAKARTHYPKCLLGDGYWQPAPSINHAVWVLAFARTTVESMPAEFGQHPVVHGIRRQVIQRRALHLLGISPALRDCDEQVAVVRQRDADGFVLRAVGHFQVV